MNTPLPACTVVDKHFLTPLNTGGAPEGCHAAFCLRAEKTFNPKDKRVCENVRETQRQREGLCVFDLVQHTHD